MGVICIPVTPGLSLGRQRPHGRTCSRRLNDSRGGGRVRGGYLGGGGGGGAQDTLESCDKTS